MSDDEDLAHLRAAFLKQSLDMAHAGMRGDEDAAWRSAEDLVDLAELMDELGGGLDD